MAAVLRRAFCTEEGASKIERSNFHVGCLESLFMNALSLSGMFRSRWLPQEDFLQCPNGSKCHGMSLCSLIDRTNLPSAILFAQFITLWPQQKVLPYQKLNVQTKGTEKNIQILLFCRAISKVSESLKIPRLDKNFSALATRRQFRLGQSFGFGLSEKTQ